MRLTSFITYTVMAAMCIAAAAPAAAQDGNGPQTVQSGSTSGSIRISGTVRDEANAIALPGIPIEVVGTKQIVYTDMDGKYVIEVPPGEHEIKVTMDGYQPRIVKVTAGAQRNVSLDVALTMQGFTEQVLVTGRTSDAASSTAEALMIQRKQASTIMDSMGSDDMKRNGDSDAAAAMARVTGLSVVDGQYVFVRGLGERYSNTTLAGSVLPTTEPDKKVVPLDIFPSGLIDSVQVSKSYTPDKSSEFAGGLVQIVPLKFPSRPVFDVSYGLGHYSNATGKQIPVSPMGTKDWLGYDDGARSLPGGIPNEKIVRAGIFTPDVGYNADQITEFGKLMAGGPWQPQFDEGKLGQKWEIVFGNRFGKLGVVASFSQAYKEQAIDENRKFYRVEGGTGEDVELEAVTDYDMRYGQQKAQLGGLGNLAYQFNSNHRLSFENFYTHNAKDEGRVFEGFNLDNNREYRNFRQQYVEEGLMSNAVRGEHFLQGLGSSRIEWRVNSGRATRDEPRLREVLYEYVPPSNPSATPPPFVLADESQSGFQMYNTLDDDTWDTSVDWSMFRAGGKPTQYKFGARYVDRQRDFLSRRFRFIPITATKDGALAFNNQLPPDELYIPANVGTAFRFNEETRPTDAYNGTQTTAAGYGMIDITLSAATRLVAGARVENFDQEVNTFDPFGLFVRTQTATNQNTDFFPAVNLVQAIRNNTNFRASYSTTVNRPEMRELAGFEFTDIVGARAVRGNPDLKRALIQNFDGRLEAFSGSRGIVAASVFYKYFDQPIETVVLGAAQPITTYQNSDSARNVGIELEAARQLTNNFFINANYTFVDSKVTLLPEQTTVQTSLERALVGQSKNLFNVTGEVTFGGFSTRLLYNYFGDRIVEAGANNAPDVVEQGRSTVDLVIQQRWRPVTFRLGFENLGDSDYSFTQGGEQERFYKFGRTIAFSMSYNLFQ